MKVTFLLLFLHVVIGVPQHQGAGYPEYHSPVLAQQHNQQPPLVCRIFYETLWETSYNDMNTQECTKHYKKECKIDDKEVCINTYKTVCEKVVEEKCLTSYKQECRQEHRKEYEHYTETECTTLEQEHCDHRWEGEGNEKVWVVIPGSCVSNPYDVCKDIPKTKELLIPVPICENVPVEQCVDVPRDKCREVPDIICKTKPFETCESVPMKECKEDIRKVPVRFSRKVLRHVCDHSYQGKQVPSQPYEQKTVVPSPNYEQQLIVPSQPYEQKTVVPSPNYQQPPLGPSSNYEQLGVGYLQSILDVAQNSNFNLSTQPSITGNAQKNLTFTAVDAVPGKEIQNQHLKK